MGIPSPFYFILFFSWWHLCIFPTLGLQTDACEKMTDESNCGKSIAFQMVCHQCACGSMNHTYLTRLSNGIIECVHFRKGPSY